MVEVVGVVVEGYGVDVWDCGLFVVEFVVEFDGVVELFLECVDVDFFEIGECCIFVDCFVCFMFEDDEVCLMCDCCVYVVY